MATFMLKMIQNDYIDFRLTQSVVFKRSVRTRMALQLVMISNVFQVGDGIQFLLNQSECVMTAVCKVKVKVDIYRISTVWS